MNKYQLLLKKATRLVKKLQEDIDTGKRVMCENYGQKEIIRFQDKNMTTLKSGELTYQEECSIKDILHKVSLIS